MTWSAPSQEAVEEWREHPVTVALREALQRQHAAQKQALLQAYWQGNLPPESARISLHRMEAFLADFFEADADDLEAVMEQFDEYERHTADGIQRDGAPEAG